MGGGEFVVAFSDESAESARSILDRARREFIRFYFDGEHGERFQATFSAGVACYPEAGETIEDVFKVADRRLYAVKEMGRNNIFAHDPEKISETSEQEDEEKASLSSISYHETGDEALSQVTASELPSGPSTNDQEIAKPQTEKADQRPLSTGLLPPFSDED